MVLEWHLFRHTKPTARFRGESLPALSLLNWKKRVAVLIVKAGVKAPRDKPHDWVRHTTHRCLPRVCQLRVLVTSSLMVFDFSISMLTFQKLRRQPGPRQRYRLPGERSDRKPYTVGRNIIYRNCRRRASNAKDASFHCSQR